VPPTSTGTISNLQSAQLSNPSAKPDLMNLGLLLVPGMPGGTVDVGESWTTQSAMYLPPNDNMPAQLRISCTFSYKGMAPGNRARISVALREASGETGAKVDVKGDVFFDIQKGRVDSFTVKGELEIRKVVMWTVPVTISVASR